MNPDLSQLRDIHLPAPISWWPPAPGWWLISVLLVIIPVVSFFIMQRKFAGRWRREALAELEKMQSAAPREQLAQLSVLLRRVALSRFPRTEVAALTGEAWLVFLDRNFDNETPFQSGVGQLLISGPYAPGIDGDVAEVTALCARWIQRLPERMTQ